MKEFEHGGNIHAMAKSLGVRIENIVDFSANINPLGLPESLKKALIDRIHVIEHYPDPEYKDLKKAIGEYHGLKEQYITVGNGATEIIYKMITGLQPRKSLILAPTFSEYEKALDKIGCEVKYYYLREEKGFQIDEGFLRALEEDIDLVVLCNPNNPTGQLVERKILRQILDNCRENRIGLMMDEAFIDFVSVQEEETMIHYIEDYKRLYIIRALTKFFALPGLRLGYGITAHRDLLDKIEAEAEPWSINSYAALAGEIVLKDKSYIQKSRSWIEQEQKRFYAELEKIDQIKVYAPKANYILFQLLDKEKEIQELLMKKNILIRSCSNYKNLENNYYRVAIKDYKANNTFITALKEILNES